ncbi:MAG: alcohol dehydrogenase catalytic domain-containing protein [Anaerolineae bacterium]
MPDTAVPTHMRAARLYGVRDIRLDTIPVPEPGPAQVLLKIASVGICGSDVHYFLDGRIGSQVVTAPIILGHEFAAHVVRCGAGVEGLTAGQLVAVEPGMPCGACEPCREGHPNLCLHVRFCGSPPVDGVLAEYAVMPAANCFPLPAGVSPDEGALLEPLGIGLHTVDLAHLRAGQTVAVFGAGPIGLLIAAVARLAGAAELYVSEPIAVRRQFAQRYLGAAVFDPTAEDVVSAILGMTGGRGVDVAFEAAGVLETPQQAAAVTRAGGMLILAGIPADDRLVLTASTVRHRGLTIKLVRRMKHTYPRAIRLLKAGMIDLTPLATHVFPLERTQEAFELAAGCGDGVLRAMVHP